MVDLRQGDADTNSWTIRPKVRSVRMLSVRGPSRSISNSNLSPVLPVEVVHLISFQSPKSRTSNASAAFTEWQQSGQRAGASPHSRAAEPVFSHCVFVTLRRIGSIQNVETRRENGSFVFRTPAVTVDESGNPISRPVPDSEILAHLDRHSKAVTQDSHRKPEFCAACHKASLPPELNHYKWIRSFTTYDEWQDSSYSHQTPLTFYSTEYKSCQDCHMMRELLDGKDYGAKDGRLASHRWLAGNTAVPFYYGNEEQLEKTTAFLKADNCIDVDLFALKPASSSPSLVPLGNESITLSPRRIGAGLRRDSEPRNWPFPYPGVAPPL